jgi:hypothetical protein
MGGDSRDVHAAAAVLDHHEDVETTQEHGVDVGEVDREDRVGLCGEELSPGGAGPSRGGVEACGLEDRPDGGGGDGLPRWSVRAASASSARGRTSGTRVGTPRREIMLRGLWTVTARSIPLVLNALVRGRVTVLGTDTRCSTERILDGTPSQ